MEPVEVMDEKTAADAIFNLAEFVERSAGTDQLSWVQGFVTALDLAISFPEWAAAMVGLLDIGGMGPETRRHALTQMVELCPVVAETSQGGE